jgi:hypothetical protein
MSVPGVVKFEGETEVNVYSALGGHMGSFYWHTDDLAIIDEMDKRSLHGHLHYEGQKDGCRQITNPCDC